MKNNKCFGNVLFWLTLLSPIISFSLASLIGETDIFGVAGIIRYSWIMWIFLPVGIISLVIGIKYKKSNPMYIKNLIISSVCLPLLLLFGSYRFIFNNNVSYDVEYVYAVEMKAKINIPKKIKIATNTFDSYSLSYVKIINEEEVDSFEYEISTNQLWENQLNTNIKKLLPEYVQYELVNFDYYLFYNLTTDSYNVPLSYGDFECVFVAYDHESHRLMVIDDLKISKSD